MDMLAEQREFFATGKTLDGSFRIKMLKELKKGVVAFQDKICAALRADLGKTPEESYMTEIGLVLSELSYMISHTRKFAKKRRVRTPLAQFWSSTYEVRSPYGVVLIMSPWNYPFMLSIDPLIDAIAAGNVAVVKPSAYSPETSRVVAELVASCLPSGLAKVVLGGHDENKALLEQKFDYIFFTGGKTFGREVMKIAADTLTPVTLELGGKSPCLVDASADLKVAARRIVFGKFLNCGQTCVAPDYLVVERAVKDRLVSLIRAEIEKQYGPDPVHDDSYGKIINKKHFDRLSALCPEAVRDEKTLKIAPTVVEDATPDHPLMQDEIFGPILPVLTVDKIGDAKEIVARHPTPLALYVFTSKGKVKRDFLQTVAFGGGCVNDTIIHLATSEAGFGGVGTSGTGAYHGRVGFETFTHVKTVVDKKTLLDLPMRYRPADKFKTALIRMFVR